MPTTASSGPPRWPSTRCGCGRTRSGTARSSSSTGSPRRRRRSSTSRFRGHSSGRSRSAMPRRRPPPTGFRSTSSSMSIGIPVDLAHEERCGRLTGAGERSPPTHACGRLHRPERVRAAGVADYAAVPIAALHQLPEHVTFDQGARTDNLGVALWAIERGRLRAGERVVVIGPGAIGLCATQLARALGAGRVTLVGRGKRLARVRDMADEVVDAADVARLHGTADLVVEFAGTADAARDAIALARRGGRAVLGGATGAGVELSGVDLSTIVRGNLDVLGSLANPKGVSGRALELLAQGKIDMTSLVTHHFPLERFEEAWRTFTERRDGAIRVMLHPQAAA